MAAGEWRLVEAVEAAVVLRWQGVKAAEAPKPTQL